MRVVNWIRERVRLIWRSLAPMIIPLVCEALITPVMANDRPVALVGATLIDGTGKPVLDAVVIVKNGGFVASGSAHSVTVPADTTGTPPRESMSFQA